MMMKQPVAVLGAGTMGRGIAQVCAQAGHLVRVRDVNPQVLEQARGHIQKALEKGVQLGKITQTAADETFARIRFETALEAALQGAAWAIEAVPEDVALKQRVLREAETALGETAILASNTSSLSIGSLASVLQRPHRFVGLHFFNPPHLLKLLEVVHGPKTDRQVTDAAVRFATDIGKEPIVVRDSPGFASSRLGLALGLEAMRMLEEGVATAADIDKAMELGYNHPMGPLKLTDLVGLDVRLAIAEHLSRTLDDRRFAPPAILRRLVEAGKLGKKSGEGFYTYPATNR